jgi:hypothetical protein
LSAPALDRIMHAMRTLTLRTALLLVAGLAPALPRPALAVVTPLERRIVASVERHTPQALALLQRAVDQNSGTLNLAGVRAVGAMFEPEFERLGFRTRWVDGAAWGRAGHLIAERGRSSAISTRCSSPPARSSASRGWTPPPPRGRASST